MSDRPDSRTDDYNEIEKGLKSPNWVDRDQARKAKDRLDSETRDERKLREDLIRAHRYRERGEIEELHRKLHEIGKHRGR